MTFEQRPILVCLVGINGAGKSTFYREKLKQWKLPFINADILARERWPDEADKHAYEAGRIVAEQRVSLIEAGRSFVTETVFSHPSKLQLLELAMSSGFQTLLIYIHLQSEELAKFRVEERVARGGHPVPDDKIGPRYRRLFQQVKTAVPVVDKAMLFDNSRREAPFLHIATIRSGVLTKSVNPLPSWAKAIVG